MVGGVGLYDDDSSSDYYDDYDRDDNSISDDDEQYDFIYDITSIKHVRKIIPMYPSTNLMFVNIDGSEYVYNNGNVSLYKAKDGYETITVIKDKGNTIIHTYNICDNSVYFAINGNTIKSPVRALCSCLSHEADNLMLCHGNTMVHFNLINHQIQEYMRLPINNDINRIFINYMHDYILSNDTQLFFVDSQSHIIRSFDAGIQDMVVTKSFGVAVNSNNKMYFINYDNAIIMEIDVDFPILSMTSIDDRFYVINSNNLEMNELLLPRLRSKYIYPGKNIRQYRNGIILNVNDYTITTRSNDNIILHRYDFSTSNNYFNFKSNNDIITIEGNVMYQSDYLMYNSRVIMDDASMVKSVTGTDDNLFVVKYDKLYIDDISYNIDISNFIDMIHVIDDKVMMIFNNKIQIIDENFRIINEYTSNEKITSAFANERYIIYLTPENKLVTVIDNVNMYSNNAVINKIHTNIVSDVDYNITIVDDVTIIVYSEYQTLKHNVYDNDKKLINDFYSKLRYQNNQRIPLINIDYVVIDGERKYDTSMVNIFDTLKTQREHLITKNANIRFKYRNAITGVADSGIDENGLTNDAIAGIFVSYLINSDRFFVEHETPYGKIYDIKPGTEDFEFLGELFGIGLLNRWPITLLLHPLLLYQMIHETFENNIDKETVYDVINDYNSEILNIEPYKCYDINKANVTDGCKWDDDAGEFINLTEEKTEQMTTEKINNSLSLVRDNTRKFVNGFRSIVKFSVDDVTSRLLSLLISQVVDPTIELFDEHINYVMDTSHSIAMKEVIHTHSLTNDDYLKQLMRFMTGNPYIPIVGYPDHHKLRLISTSNITESRPYLSHTCFNYADVRTNVLEEYVNKTNTVLFDVFSYEDLKLQNNMGFGMA